jgi:hypothetical protein
MTTTPVRHIDIPLSSKNVHTEEKPQIEVTLLYSVEKEIKFFG